MIDFNGTSIRLGLMYAKRLGNRVNYMFMFTFFVYMFFRIFFFAAETNNFLDRSAWPIDGTLKITAIPDHSGSESNVHKGLLYTTQIFNRWYSQCILRSTD